MGNRPHDPAQVGVVKTCIRFWSGRYTNPPLFPFYAGGSMPIHIKRVTQLVKRAEEGEDGKGGTYAARHAIRESRYPPLHVNISKREYSDVPARGLKNK